jgi:hypothetical protein
MDAPTAFALKNGMSDHHSLQMAQLLVADATLPPCRDGRATQYRHPLLPGQ